MHTDKLFRAVFGNLADAAAWLSDLLRDQPLAGRIDWSTLRTVRATAIDARLRRREPDFVFAAKLIGSAQWVLILVEHTTGRRRRVRRQMLHYCVEALDLWDAERPECPIGFVLPIVLHTGKRELDARLWLDASAAATLIGRDNAGFAYGMLVDDLATQTEGQILARHLPARVTLALLVSQQVCGRKPDDVEAALLRWQELIRTVAAAPGEDDGIELFQSYILGTTEMPLDRCSDILDRILGQDGADIMMTTAKKLIAEGRAQGLAEGRAEGHESGKARGMRHLLQVLLQERFHAMPAHLAAKLEDASTQQLEAWTRRALAAHSIEDVFSNS